MKKHLSILLCIVIVLSLLAGCAQPPGGAASAPASSAPSPSAASPGGASSAGSSVSEPAPAMPISQSPLTLTFFWEADPKATVVIKDYSEMEVFRKMAEITNVTMQFIHPPSGQGIEQFNLMVASGDLPDMALLDTGKLTGGLAQYLADDLIVPLNDSIDQYMPNLSAFLAENPAHSKQARLDDGTMAYFPMFTISDNIMVTTGMQIRTNWLENLNLDPPETLDDWYKVLTAFKEQDANGNGDPNDEIPFVPRGGNNNLPDMMQFGLPYKVSGHDFYLYDGRIGYGPYAPELKDVLTLLNKWYNEGLIDPDYLSTDNAAFEAKILNNIGGAYTGTVNGNMGKFLGLWEAEHPDYKITPLAAPKAGDGTRYGTNQKAYASPQGLIVTTSNKHLPETMRYMDYLYGPEGYLLTNFGIEGKSYTMVDGKPQFTDEILKNPDKLPVINALHKYNYAVSQGVCLQGEEAFFATATYPSQIEAYKVWGDSNIIRMNVNGLAPTVEESGTLAKIVNDTKTYSAEMINKFIMGQEPLSNFDAYRETLKSMKIEDAIAIQQAMYERYLKR